MGASAASMRGRAWHSHGYGGIRSPHRTEAINSYLSWTSGVMKLLSIVALVVVVIAATVAIAKHSDDILVAFTKRTDSSAQVPGLIAFQAVLTDATGTLVDDGDYTVTFAFYSAGAGGLFNTHLSNTNPSASSTSAIDEIWLGLTVGSDTYMTSRQWMVSTVSAHVA